jgi:transketolase
MSGRRLLEKEPQMTTLVPNAEIERVADAVRRRVLVHTIRNNGGYLCQACSSAEMLATLYLRAMRLGPSHGPPVPVEFRGVPGKSQAVSGAAYNGGPGPDNDHFILSAAHYALVLYATLIEVGRLAPEALEHFNRDGSTVEMIGAEHSPGMEATTGSLGQGLSVALGMAMARRRRGESGRVWVFMSDGELQSGEIWEAIGMAAHHGIDNLGVYLDANGNQVDGPIVDVQRIEPAAERVRTFGWRVHEVDGHDPDALAEPALEPPDGRSLMVIARTCPWQGIPSLAQRAPKLHFLRFRPGEAELALADCGLTMEEVPA